MDIENPPPQILANEPKLLADGFIVLYNALLAKTYANVSYVILLNVPCMYAIVYDF